MTATVLHGDCRVLMAAMVEASIDSIATDPPYELGFMGRSWDKSGIANDVAMWGEALRVLKPGGILVAFSHARTYHRMACAIEDAGFEIRDQIMWLYGSGFPKGGNRDGKGSCLKPAHEPIVVARKPLIGSVAANEALYGTGAINIDVCRVPTDETLRAGAGVIPMRHDEATPRALPGARYDAAKRGTLEEFRRMPGAVPPNKLGRWPANVVHDGSDEVLAAFPEAPGQQARSLSDGSPHGNKVYGKMLNAGPVHEPRDAGGSAARFFKTCGWGKESEWLAQNLPSALASIVGGYLPLQKLLACFAQNVAATSALPEGMQFAVATAPSISVTENESEQIGVLLIRAIRLFESALWREQPLDELTLSRSHVRLAVRPTPTGIIMTMTGLSTSNGCAEPAIFSITPENAALGAQGFAERFRYCAKASKSDRDEGLDHLDPQAFVQFQTGNGESGAASSLSEGRETQYRNIHPTVKPEGLMRWLVRLYTPPGGTVLDPFTGSGSTGKAAVLEGLDFIGCELTDEYVPIARARIAAAEVRAADVPAPSPQLGLFEDAA